MRSYWAFVKKEWLESLRTFRLMILLIVFLLFGVISPVTAKFTPQLLRAVGIDPAAFGMATVTVLDSWVQFFKNVGQMGLLVTVIVFCGMVANEFSKGTLELVLTKGLRRSTVLLSKFTTATLLWTVSYLLCLFTCLGYTAFLFETEGVQHMFVSFFSMWLYGVWLITLLILGGVLFKSVLGSLLVCGGAAMALSLLQFLFPNANRYNPASLASENVKLLAGQTTPSDLLPAMLIGIGLIIGCMTASILVFNKKQI